MKSWKFTKFHSSLNDAPYNHVYYTIIGALFWCCKLHWMLARFNLVHLLVPRNTLEWTYIHMHLINPVSFRSPFFSYSTSATNKHFTRIFLSLSLSSLSSTAAKKKEKGTFYHFSSPISQCRCPVIYSAASLQSVQFYVWFWENERNPCSSKWRSDFRWKREDYPARQQWNNINENVFSFLFFGWLGFLDAKPKQITVFLPSPFRRLKLPNFFFVVCFQKRTKYVCLHARQL